MQRHRSDTEILGRRTLEANNRHLAALLGPGNSVLDVGCGVGSIAAGAARRVGPAGCVVGVDRDPALLAIARLSHRLPNLSFEEGDALNLGYENRFDVVSASRVLQWVGDPASAVRQMARAAKPGGRVVILDYDHARNQWIPEPPKEFGDFYRAFLRWRDRNGWSNRMGDQLQGLCLEAGLVAVESRDESEVISRGQDQFGASREVWFQTIRSVGPRMVAAGYLTECEFARAGVSYGDWMESTLITQRLSLQSVAGVVPQR